MFTNKFYKKSPIALQNIIVTLIYMIRRSLRDNIISEHYKKELYTHDYSKDKSEEYSKKQLQKTLKNAIENLDFYKSMEGLDPNNIETFPYITKDDLRGNPDAFTAKNKGFTRFNMPTSGTTGAALVVPTTLNALVIEEAFIARVREWAGYKRGEKRAWIRADHVVPSSQTKPPYWRYSWFENQLIMSSYHITPKSMPIYLEKLMDYDPIIIHTYPSVIIMFAKYLQSKGIYYKGSLKAVITSSESFNPDDRDVVEKYFNCKVVEWYGMTERASAISNCEHGNFHVITDYAHTEFLDMGDGRHEIVGTSFNNALFPVVRYRTGDYVRLKESQSCPCGRAFPLASNIEGRTGDHLYGENGQKVFVLNTVPKGVIGLLASQLIQNQPKHIEALVIIDTVLFNDVQAQKLTENIRLHLGQSMEVTITPVDSLPKTKNGKTRQIVCNIEQPPVADIVMTE
ncbi:MAG: AMP-binding protein [Marinobacterium sp.]|nr:AMP-binding protein [Marinobacterium sp.]